MKKTVLALALLATTASAFAADSVDVRVIGTIVPAACTPTLSGGGTVDYGTIKADTISATDYTVLPAKEIDFSIQCDAPAKVAIKAVTGRPGTTAGVTESSYGAAATPVSLFGMGDIAVVGLGMDGADKIGGYAVRINPGSVTVDSVAANNLRKSDSATSWTQDAYAGMLFDPNFSRSTTWGTSGTTPVAFTNLAGKLGVQAYINKGENLDLTEPVNLDGLTTITLVYM
ncbi:DUF1120 domain-containing protein [Erwinia aphidicola]|nr:DUF1120 domain-containing protein [Erwinia aphidicola]